MAKAKGEDSVPATSFAAVVREAFRENHKQTDSSAMDAAIDNGFTALRELNQLLERGKRLNFEITQKSPSTDVQTPSPSSLPTLGPISTPSDLSKGV